MKRRQVIIGAGALAVGAAGYGLGAFRAAQVASIDRITGAAQVAATRAGRVDYAMAGDGPPVLMLHGTGGGFDQGLAFAQGIAARGFRIIAPSRFGYLGSAFPDDASPAAQAHALADLLDHLRIARLAVAGGSAGALSAAAFAILYPERCEKLVLLVPAMNLTGRDPVAFTTLQRAVVARVLGLDALFWAASSLAPQTMIGTLLATDPALLDAVSPEERARAFRTLRSLMPISRRARGIAADGHFAGAPFALEIGRVSCPVLAISAEDDRFGTAGTARLIGDRLAGAETLIFPQGGHIWLGHDADMAEAVAAFLRR